MFNASHLQLNRVRLTSEATAFLDFVGTAYSLREATYSFSLHVPLWNGSGWQFKAIEGAVDVRAVADAKHSSILVNRTTIAHLDELPVEIIARDVDGNLIERDGEQLTLTVGRVGRLESQRLHVLATFDTKTKRYKATLRGFIDTGDEYPMGEYSVGLFGSNSSMADNRTRFSVSCDSAYREIDRQCTVEEPAKGSYPVVYAIVGGLLLVALALTMLTLRRAKHCDPMALLQLLFASKAKLVAEIAAEVL